LDQRLRQQWYGPARPCHERIDFVGHRVLRDPEPPMQPGGNEPAGHKRKRLFIRDWAKLTAAGDESCVADTHMRRDSGWRDPYNLERFVAAQQPVFERVRAELQAGEKRSHWMWYVFPQITGLGRGARRGLAEICR
jgi:hypothetical protein